MHMYTQQPPGFSFLCVSSRRLSFLLVVSPRNPLLRSPTPVIVFSLLLHRPDTPLFLRQKQVKKLPHLELYVGQRGRLESFVCGPSKSAVLKEKLDKLVADPQDPSLGEAPIPDEESFAEPPPGEEEGEEGKSSKKKESGTSL